MLTYEIYMQLSNVVSRLAGLEPDLPLDLSLGRATLHCLNGSFLVIYQDRDANDLTDLEVRYLLYGIQVDTRTLLLIYVNKYCNN